MADEIALVDNLIRRDLTAVEPAEALDRTKTEHDHTPVQLASIIGKSETTVSEIVSLIKLPTRETSRAVKAKEMDRPCKKL